MPLINPTVPNDGENADAVDISGPIAAILAVINGAIDQDNLANSAVILSKLSTAVQNSLVPVGTITPYGGASAPNSDWLLCYGQAVSRSTYSALFAIIGTLYGVGDGSTTFNVPDMRGRVPIGNDALGGTAANRSQRSTTLGTTNANATATPASMTGLAVGMTIVSANVPAGTTITAVGASTITMSANATATASGVAVRFSMLVDAQVLGQVGGTDVQTLLVEQLAVHTHVITTKPAGSATPDEVGKGDGSSGSQANGNAVQNAGSGRAHPNMQPSQVVNYIIKA